MREAIISGSLGAPLELVAVAGQHFPTYRPAYRSTYYANRATGGGAIQDALTHTLNAGEWLLGPIDRLVADADHKLLDGVDVEDVVHLLARHGPVLASYSMNQFQAPNEFTITIVCERGTARFESHLNRWGQMLQPDQEWKHEPSPVPERDSLFVAQANSFLDAIQGRGQLLCTLEEGAQTLRVNLAAMKSVESGAWQEIKNA
jgi:predicted dehydrogenase